MSLDLIVAIAIFIAAVAVVIGLSLFVLTVILRMQARHRKRLARVGRRQGHYMKADMVQSQFEALEVPADALTLDTRLSPEKIVATIKRELAL